MESCHFPYAAFETVDDVEAFPWPDPDWFDYAALPRQCRELEGYAIVYGWPGNLDLINGTAFGRGFEQTIIDIATEDPAGLRIMEKRFEFCREQTRRALEACGGAIDIVWIGDDYGTQRGLLLSPAKWRKLFRAKLQAMIDLAHRHGARLMLHSCGSTRPIWPDLADMGLDIYDTIQPEAVGMAPNELAAEFGNASACTAPSARSACCRAGLPRRSRNRCGIASNRSAPGRADRGALAQHPARHAGGEHPGDVPRRGVPGMRTMPPLARQVRWYVLGLLFLITVVNFVDRQGLSVVAPVLRDRLHLTATDYGIMVAFFQLGMMLAEFPMGTLMDRRGVRIGLTFAVVWWSLANAAHALARSMAQFCALRFWLGTGQCGNFSGGVKVVSRWFPAQERALAIGIYNGGCLIGPMIAPPLLVFLTLRMGWPAAFLLPSLAGLVLAFAWAAFYRDPERHAWLSGAEKSYIQEGAPAEPATPPSNRALLRLPQTWGIMLARMLAGPVFQFYLYWLPEYLYRERGLSLKSIGLLAWMPFLFGDIGSIGGGWVAGVLIRRGVSVPSARRITMGIGAGCCLLSLAVAGVHTWQAAIGLICVVLAGQSFFSANMYAVISDVFPSSAAGRVTALTGIANGFSGMLFPLLTGWMVDRFSYAPVFLLAAAMPLAGWAALLLLARNMRRVEI